MADRQYIGARYVIKIYENSTNPNSAEWEQGNYEPLVMVTWMNGSYLSKKEVPATAGNPASEPTYWVQTGFYNGQIAALQSQIDTINNTVIPFLQSQIDTINNTDIPNLVNLINHATDRKVLVIGDSYNTVTADGWDDVFENLVGLDSDHYYNLSGSGYGFYRNGNQTFENLLSADIDNITNKDTYTDIIVGAGANDVDVPYATLNAAISSFESYCKTQFPNATLHIAFVSWSVDRSYAGKYRNVYYAYRQICAALGISFYEGVECAMHDTTFFNTVDYPDGIHPNQNGNNAIGGAIAQAFKDGIANCNRQETASYTPNTANVTSSMTYLFNAVITNNMNYVELNAIEVTPVNAINAGDQLNIGTYNCNIFKANCVIPITNLDGSVDLLTLYWDGRVVIRFAKAHNANETISYYYAPAINFPIMRT